MIPLAVTEKLRTTLALYTETASFLTSGVLSDTLIGPCVEMEREAFLILQAAHLEIQRAGREAVEKR